MSKMWETFNGTRAYRPPGGAPAATLDVKCGVRYPSPTFRSRWVGRLVPGPQHHVPGKSSQTGIEPAEGKNRSPRLTKVTRMRRVPPETISPGPEISRLPPPLAVALIGDEGIFGFAHGSDAPPGAADALAAGAEKKPMAITVVNSIARVGPRGPMSLVSLAGICFKKFFNLRSAPVKSVRADAPITILARQSYFWKPGTRPYHSGYLFVAVPVGFCDDDVLLIPQ